MRAVVIGATGQIGYAVCRALLREGHEVVACHRGRRVLQADLKRRGCDEVVGDRHTSEAFARTLKAGADLLVDVVPMTEADAEQLLACAEGYGAIVAVSSGAVYADDRGRSLGTAQQTGYPEYPDRIHESQRTIEPDAETYAGRKVAIERRLLDHEKSGMTVLRPCAIHGVYARDLREVWFLKRLLDGRSFAPLPYDGASVFHTCAAETVAAAVLAGARSGGTRILNVADADAPTVREIGETLLGANSRLELVCFPGPPGEGVGMSPWSIPFPIRLDVSALTELRGPLPRYSVAVAPTARWAAEQLKKTDWARAFPKLASYPFPLFDYDAEDAFMRG
jgi:nucleoside-diphosphate-sugar epimerase